MKIILPFLVLSAFLFSCGQSNLHTFKKPYPDFNYSGTRFIVYSKSKIKTHQDIEKAIGRNNGRILKKLKYNKGYVAYFKDNHIVNLDKNIRFEFHKSPRRRKSQTRINQVKFWIGGLIALMLEKHGRYQPAPA